MTFEKKYCRQTFWSAVLALKIIKKKFRVSVDARLKLQNTRDYFLVQYFAIVFIMLDFSVVKVNSKVYLVVYLYYSDDKATQSRCTSGLYSQGQKYQ